jgi:hypothetical protein
MSNNTNAQGSELFEQAMKNYEQAIQAGLKLQQDSAKWWMDMISQAKPAEDWQAKASDMVSESVSVTQKRMEENLKLIEQSSQTSLQLLNKAMEATKAESVSAGQAKMQEVWEASLDAIRKNASSVQQANVKWVESMMELAPKAKPESAAKAKAA